MKHTNSGDCLGGKWAGQAATSYQTANKGSCEGIKKEMVSFGEEEEK